MSSYHHSYILRCFAAERANARWVFNTEYADAVLDLVHPGNLGPLPPSPYRVFSKARDLGLVAPEHEWIITLLP